MAPHSIRDTTATDQPATIGGLLIVAASIVLSIISHGFLADSMRIHYRWTVGTYSHYGPEYAPTLAVLAAFPVVLTGLYVGSRWLGKGLERLDEYDDLRPVYEITALAVLTTIWVAQLGLIALNVWYP